MQHETGSNFSASQAMTKLLARSRTSRVLSQLFRPKLSASQTTNTLPPRSKTNGRCHGVPGLNEALKASNVSASHTTDQLIPRLKNTNSCCRGDAVQNCNTKGSNFSAMHFTNKLLPRLKTSGRCCSVPNPKGVKLVSVHVSIPNRKQSPTEIENSPTCQTKWVKLLGSQTAKSRWVPVPGAGSWRC